MSAPTRRGVVLDRDGTLVDFVRDPELGVVTPAFHPEQLRLLPGVVDGLRALAREGFALAIATNQPGAAKGELPREAIERTNHALVERLAREGVAVERLVACLHHPHGGERGDPRLIGPCDCRKPAPGLLLELVHELRLDAARSYAIGDTLTDVAAARAAGLEPVLVAPERRCEICPLKDEPALGASVALWAGRFDQAVTALLAHARGLDPVPAPSRPV